MICWLSFPAPSFTPSRDPVDKHNYRSLPPSLALFSPLERDTILYAGYGLLQISRSMQGLNLITVAALYSEVADLRVSRSFEGRQG